MKGNAKREALPRLFGRAAEVRKAEVLRAAFLEAVEETRRACRFSFAPPSRPAAVRLELALRAIARERVAAMWVSRFSSEGGRHAAR